VVLAAVAQDGHALEYASAELKGDREVVLVAVTQHGLALEWAQQSCRETGRWYLRQSHRRRLHWRTRHPS